MRLKRVSLLIVFGFVLITNLRSQDYQKVEVEILRSGIAFTTIESGVGILFSVPISEIRYNLNNEWSLNLGFDVNVFLDYKPIDVSSILAIQACADHYYFNKKNIRAFVGSGLSWVYGDIYSEDDDYHSAAFVLRAGIELDFVRFSLNNLLDPRKYSIGSYFGATIGFCIAGRYKYND